MWDHVHEFPHSFAIITDFSNSYLHKHKYEQMQQFWCEVSTTLLGCVMRIPIDNLKDSYMLVEEKAKLKGMLEKEGLPPLITITHVMVSPNPHHDTAVVQHFWKTKLMAWVWENTQGLENGHMFVRSDNCGGQFKSARHFRSKEGQGHLLQVQHFDVIMALRCSVAGCSTMSIRRRSGH
jgi:hypothetical protein